MTVDYAKTLTAAERVITTSDGTKISTITMGSGTPIVLAHGCSGDIR